MPDPSAALELTTPVTALAGVGARTADALHRLGIRRVADLVRHLPMRYERDLGEQSVAAAESAVGAGRDGEATIAVRGELAAVRPRPGRKTRLEATLEDDTGTIRLVWFNAGWLRRKLHPGMHLLVQGKATRYGGYLQMVNPRWESADPAAPLDPPPTAPPTAPTDLLAGDAPAARLRPVYPATEDLPSRRLDQLVEQVLDDALPAIDDHLEPSFRRSRSLLPLAEAYRLAHRPADLEEAAAARRRLAYDELLLLQLGVMMKRRHRRETCVAPALERSPGIDAAIRQRLPFALTPAQDRVVEEIAADLSRPVPMNRLLQGDVGAGKTVVALYGMLMAAASGAQSALLAPTELLAEQHFATIAGLLADSQVRLALFTGTLKAAERTDLLRRLETGEIDLVVGTHALLTDAVRFRSLALAVIDEQHRFGVAQRAAFRTKGGEPGEDEGTTDRPADADRRPTVPHVLVMTATPIPRTLSLTIFGDLDVSTIGELPPGRQPVITRVVPPARAPDVYAFLRERIDAGEQAFVIVPAVDESDLGLADVAGHLAQLEQGIFKGLRLGAVHGRLDRSARDDVMQRFRRGELDVLVATVVVEVGVDVPNASLMVIEHAERFGLAQLHQLRGRVGRGDRRSLCVLVGEPTTEEGRRRLEAIAGTTDGFEIAEQDLVIRGPGELFGARQSGLPPFHVAELPRDLALLAEARRDAQEWIERSPTLDDPTEQLLRRRLLRAHGEALGLGDVA